MILRKEALYIGLIVLAWTSPVWANPDVIKSGDSSTVSNSKEDPWWLRTHETVSKKVDQWSQGIDNFLSGNDSDEVDDSYVRVRFGSTFGQEDGTSGFFDFRTRLKLPNTRDRLRLVIESDGDRLTSDNLTGERGQANSVKDSVAKSTVSAALRYIKSSWGADLDVGILVGFPLDPFTRARFSQGHDYQHYSWWQDEEAFLYYTKGAGVHYNVGISHRINDRVSYGSDFSTSWLKQEDKVYARENVFLQHRLSDTSHFTYQLSFLQEGESRIKSTSYLYFVQYERLLYKNWLIGQVKPQITHEADKNYRANASLTLSLEVLFGRPYLAN